MPITAAYTAHSVTGVFINLTDLIQVFTLYLTVISLYLHQKTDSKTHQQKETKIKNFIVQRHIKVGYNQKNMMNLGWIGFCKEISFSFLINNRRDGSSDII